MQIFYRNLPLYSFSLNFCRLLKWKTENIVQWERHGASVLCLCGDKETLNSPPRGMMVIRELSVLLNILCSSSRAEIIFSIWALLSGPAVLGFALNRPALMPAVPVVVPSVILESTPAALVLRNQCFRYWLGFSAGDFSGTADAWARLGRGCGGFTKPGEKNSYIGVELDDFVWWCSHGPQTILPLYEKSF